MIETIRSRLFRSPPEGWLSLLLVAILAVTVAWSLDDAALVLGQRDWTDFLPWAALGGVAMGFIGARVGWNRPVAALVGAMVASLAVPLMVGAVLVPHASWSVAYRATTDSVVNAVIDFAVLNLPVTREAGHYLLVLGLLCWANGMFAASAVFRHGRPVGPIVVLGAVLVANMSATLHDQIWFLVLFSLASLFLLIRLHALEERATWIRRRIGDPTVVGSLYLRGGTVFIMIAVFLALTLTASARSAPLAGFWEDAKPALVDISQWLQRIIPAAPDSKTIGVPAFGGQVVIGGLWSTSDDPALEISRSPGDDRKLYWRATTYDTFTLTGWTTTAPQSDARPANTPILDGTLDAIPATAARTEATFRVAPQSSLFHVAFTPADPVTVDRDTTLNTAGADGFMQSIAIDERAPYTVKAAIPTIADVAGGLTENRLRAAGTDYPPSVLSRYLAIPANAMGPEATRLDNDLMARVKASGHTTPFDVATCDRDRTAVAEVQLPDERPRGVRSGGQRRRVLRRPQGRLLRALREHDDDPPPEGEHPGPPRRGLPAGRRGPGDRQGAGPDRRGARLGRGLLPGLRLGDVRPDRRRRGTDRDVARGDGRAAGIGQASSVGRAPERRSA